MPDLSGSYNEWHKHRLNAEGDSALDPRNFACWHKMVSARLGDLRGLKVAEVGCGRGNFAIYLAQQGAAVTAMDFSPEAIDIARDRGSVMATHVDWRVGDAQATQLETGGYDMVISCECMEHVPNPEAMMCELARLLKPGGRLLLTTPSQLNAQLLAWLHAWWIRQPYNSGSGVQPHENLFFTWQIRRLIQKAGMRVTGREATIYPLLMLPRCDPRKLRIESIHNRIVARWMRPFGLHQLYEAEKPVA